MGEYCVLCGRIIKYEMKYVIYFGCRLCDMCKCVFRLEINIWILYDVKEGWKECKIMCLKK